MQLFGSLGDYFPKMDLMIIFPTLRSSPAFEVGMPVFRAIFCFVWVIPTARFHENDKPGIFILNINYGCKKITDYKKSVCKKGVASKLYILTQPHVNSYAVTSFLPEKSLTNSPIQRTSDVAPIMISQSRILSGCTLKNSPPKVTIRI